MSQNAKIAFNFLPDFSKYAQNFLSDKKLISYDDPRSSLEATFAQSYFRNLNLLVFTGVQLPVFWFCSQGYTIVSVVNISHENKQKKSHLLTKFNNWHRRTRGKFILLNLKSIGKYSRVLH